MDTIQYIGEHLWPGRLGHFAIILSFVTAFLAALAFFFGTQRRALPADPASDAAVSMNQN